MEITNAEDSADGNLTNNGATETDYEVSSERLDVKSVEVTENISILEDTTTISKLDHVVNDTKYNKYELATQLIADAMNIRNITQVTACICWGVGELHFVRYLSLMGFRVQLLRGKNTKSSALKSIILENYSSIGVVVDLRCSRSHLFLIMASKLRLYHISAFHIIFENAAIADPNESPTNTLLPLLAPSYLTDFEEYEALPKYQFGARKLEDIAQQGENALRHYPPQYRSENEMKESSLNLLTASGYETLKDLQIFGDSNVLWVQETDDETISHLPGDENTDKCTIQGLNIFRSSMVRPLHVYLEGCANRQGGRWKWMLSPGDKKNISRARADLEGAGLRSFTIILFPEYFTTIDDLNSKQYDIGPKMHYPLLQTMADHLNFSLAIVFQSNYGWDDGTGKFDGSIGELQNHNGDFIGTGLFIRNERMHVIDMTAETFNLKTTVMFRQPSKSSVENVFLLPFSPGVWKSVGILSILTTAVLILQAICYRRHIHNKDEPATPESMLTISDCFGFVLGALCQQGFYVTPKTVAPRITIITTFTASLFLFTSFSASIVAILQSPSTALKTIDDIVHSKLEFGVQDIKYHHVWFEDYARNPLIQTLIKEKLSGNVKKGFMPTIKGVKKLREGRFAFQAETNECYKEISDTFQENEKCDLAEMQLFATDTLCLGVVKRSPYKEIFGQSIRWHREVGILNRIHGRWRQKKPMCPFSLKGFVPIGIQEFYPALLVLYYGMLIAVAILFLEKIYNNRAIVTCFVNGIMMEKSMSARIRALDKSKPIPTGEKATAFDNPAKKFYRME